MKTREKYKRLGFKLTPQRLAILEFMEGNTSHPSADEIFRVVSEDYPAIVLATVYNTLDALKRKGELIELTIKPDRRHYDPNTKPHHHITCTACGKIGDVPEEQTPSSPLAGDFGDFKVLGWQINFSGICGECNKESPGGGEMEG